MATYCVGLLPGCMTHYRMYAPMKYGAGCKLPRLHGSNCFRLYTRIENAPGPQYSAIIEL